MNRLVQDFVSFQKFPHESHVMSLNDLNIYSSQKTLVIRSTGQRCDASFVEGIFLLRLAYFYILLRIMITFAIELAAKKSLSTYFIYQFKLKLGKSWSGSLFDRIQRKASALLLAQENIIFQITKVLQNGPQRNLSIERKRGILSFKLRTFPEISDS